MGVMHTDSGIEVNGEFAKHVIVQRKVPYEYIQLLLPLTNDASDPMNARKLKNYTVQ